MVVKKNLPTLISYGLAVVIFLATAVYAVLYVTGYRVNWQTQTLQKTGVLAITSKPSGARLTIDGRDIHRTTPYTLRNALPDEYHIRLTLDGYRPYEKTVEVQSNQVTEEHNIDLVLEKIETTVISDNIDQMIAIGSNEAFAFTTDRQFVKISSSGVAPLDFNRLPTNIKSVLTQTTRLSLAKKNDNGNDWALGVVSGGRRWFLIVDPVGYRGQLFGAPLDQAQAEQTFWLDADRMMFLINQSLYTLDLNLGRLNLYAKNIFGATYANGGTYFITRDAYGKFSLMLDTNLFDDKPAEAVSDNLPVGRSYEIIITTEREVAVVAITPSGRGLWLMGAKPEDAANLPQFSKLATRINQILYDSSKNRLFYVVDRELWSYSFKREVAHALRRFTAPPNLLDKRNESIFLTVGNQLMVTDPTASTVYELGDVAGRSVFLYYNSTQVWLLQNHQLESWLLRTASTNVFGNLPLWFGRDLRQSPAANTTVG
jgi:hypothetical protein